MLSNAAMQNERYSLPFPYQGIGGIDCMPEQAGKRGGMPVAAYMLSVHLTRSRYLFAGESSGKYRDRHRACRGS